MLRNCLAGQSNITLGNRCGAYLEQRLGRLLAQLVDDAVAGAVRKSLENEVELLIRHPRKMQ